MLRLETGNPESQMARSESVGFFCARQSRAPSLLPSSLIPSPSLLRCRPSQTAISMLARFRPASPATTPTPTSARARSWPCTSAANACTGRSTARARVRTRRACLGLRLVRISLIVSPLFQVVVDRLTLLLFFSPIARLDWSPYDVTPCPVFAPSQTVLKRNLKARGKEYSQSDN